MEVGKISSIVVIFVRETTFFSFHECMCDDFKIYILDPSTYLHRFLKHSKNLLYEEKVNPNKDYLHQSI